MAQVECPGADELGPGAPVGVPAAPALPAAAARLGPIADPPRMAGEPPSAPTLGRAATGDPRWARWLGWALTASLAIHLALVVVIWRIPLPGLARDALRELTTALSEAPPEPVLDPLLDLAEASDLPRDSALAAETAALAPNLAEVAEIPEAAPVDDALLEVPLPQYDEPSAPQLDDVLLATGGSGEAVAHVEGAVDRITREIARYLGESDLLVVWLMDASLSLADDREAVAQRLERIYAELNQTQTLSPGSLQGAVYRYGRTWEPLVNPTNDGGEIIAGIRGVANDETGYENVFSAVLDAAERYKPLRAREKRRLMMVIWTDESGDDEDQLEAAVRVCRALAIPVYTVGPSSMFGQREGRQAYLHPDDGQTYYLPVARGPDTVRQELLRLPYWFAGDPLPELKSGLGPYALVRLARQTGGEYFINDDPRESHPYDLETLRPFLPDYTSAEEYLRAARRSRLREAVLTAVELTWQHELRGTPELEFAPTAENYQTLLAEAQKTAAFNLYVIEQCLGGFGERGLEEAYEQERSRRWRAWYDLTRGRLLAMQVRCAEYNLACAELKGKGAQFVSEQSNRWRFAPAEPLRGGTPAARAAAEARRLLDRCRTENEGTPWARLAARELEHPLGFALAEAYVPPPPPPPVNVGGADPPDPLGRRQEQLQMIRRPEVRLPKL